MSKIIDKIKNNDYFDLFMLVEITLVFFACVTQAIDLFDSATSIFHAGIYAVLYVYSAFYILRLILNKQKPSALFYFVVAFALLSTVVLVFDCIKNVGLSNLSLGNLSYHFFTVSTLVAMYICSKHTMSAKVVKYSAFWIFAFTVMFTIMYIFFKEYSCCIKGNIQRFLTFGFSNPNKMSILLMIFIFIMFEAFFLFQNVFAKLACAVCGCVLAAYFYLTFSRNTLLIMFFVVCAVIWILIKPKAKISSVIWALTILVPLLFVAAYVFVIGNEALLEKFSFLAGAHKGLQSRAEVWGKAIDLIKNNPIFGSYNAQLAAEWPDLHNTHLAMLASYGIIAYVVFLVANILPFTKLSKGTKNRFQSIVLMLGACVLMTGMGESLMYRGSTGMFMFVGFFLAQFNSLDELRFWNKIEQKRICKRISKT